jgi:hypothetical protein
MASPPYGNTCSAARIPAWTEASTDDARPVLAAAPAQSAQQNSPVARWVGPNHQVFATNVTYLFLLRYKSLGRRVGRRGRVPRQPARVPNPTRQPPTRPLPRRDTARGPNATIVAPSHGPRCVRPVVERLDRCPRRSHAIEWPEAGRGGCHERAKARSAAGETGRLAARACRTWGAAGDRGDVSSAPPRGQAAAVLAGDSGSSSAPHGGGRMGPSERFPLTGKHPQADPAPDRETTAAQLSDRFPASTSLGQCPKS